MRKLINFIDWALMPPKDIEIQDDSEIQRIIDRNWGRAVFAPFHRGGEFRISRANGGRGHA